MKRKAEIFGLVLIFLTGCGEEGMERGIRALTDVEKRAPVKIKWEPSLKPFPVIPFPNDLAARPDPYSRTGIRLNLPLSATTKFEMRQRELMNELDGFSTFGAITIPFTGRIDLDGFFKKMTDNDPSNDPVYVINISPSSKAYRKPVLFDINYGFYPLRREPVSFNPFDPYKDYGDIIFPEENTAFIDGKWEKITWYDTETETLVLRPVLPLDQKSVYVVFITKELRDPLGNPVSSPFDYINHPFQNPKIKEGLEILKDTGLKDEDVSFAFSFTTQSITDDLEMIRDGLDGKGELSRIRSIFPPEIYEVSNFNSNCDTPWTESGEKDTPYILQAEYIQHILKPFISLIDPALRTFYSDGPVDTRDFLDFSYVDYFVFGKFKSPMFFDPQRKAFPQDLLSYNPSATDVTFLIAVPKKTEKHKPPFPVVLFGHGYSGSRLHALIYAPLFAKYGFAVASIDTMGHGPEQPIAAILGPVDSILKLPEDLLESFGSFIAPEGVSGAEMVEKIGLNETFVKLIGMWIGDKVCRPVNSAWSVERMLNYLREDGIIKVLAQGRAYDVDGDGIPDSGGDFFTADLPKTRDMMRQTIIDMMQFIRVIKSLKGRSVKDGDFNEDGVLDVGGENNDIFYIGQSMGGLHGGILMGIDNKVKRGVINVGGGGLIDIALRTDLVPVIKALYTEIMGPTIVGGPAEINGKFAGFPITLNNDRRDRRDKWKGELQTRPEELILVRNLNKGEVRTTISDKNGNFAVSIPADEGDVIEISTSRKSISIMIDSISGGMGYRRNSPDFRRLLWSSIMAIDRSDPINYAVHYNNFSNEVWSNYLLNGLEPRDVLIQISIGDQTVPDATGISLGRAAGFISLERNKKAVEEGIVLGLFPPFKNFDLIYPPEDIIPNSGLRLHLSGKFKGRHEYLAVPIYEEDTGVDGVLSVHEKGYDPLSNPDPNKDDYCTNGGTEGDGILQPEEDMNKNGTLEINWQKAGQMQAILFFLEGKIYTGITPEEVRKLKESPCQ